MKQYNDNENLAHILKQKGYHANENEWFTRRVMNQLPSKRHKQGWLKLALYVLMIAGCTGCWSWYFSTQSDAGVILVRDILSLIALAAGTLVILSLPIIDIFHE